MEPEHLLFTCVPHILHQTELPKTWTHGAILLGFCDQGQWCRWDDAREQGRKKCHQTEDKQIFMHLMVTLSIT
jgi:hypothetical protein